jgi:alpha-L-rhamnosidase
MGDAQVFLRTAIYNMDVAAFFTKWMRDICDAQTADGIFPDTAPRLPEDEGNFVGLDGLGGGPAWADAGIIVPWTIWKIYGDTDILHRHWPHMVAWMHYLERVNPEWLRVNELGNNYGDWLCIPTDTSFRSHSPMKDLLATAFWADSATKMTGMAQAVGDIKTAEHFDQVFQRISDAFQNAFLVPDGQLRVETQTAYLISLAFNLIPESMKTRAVDRLVDLIDGNGGHLNTGFVGIRFLNPVLCDHGRQDIAYDLLLREDFPSWLYPVKHGATTIWERWNGWTREDGFFNPQMNSFNHYSLGSVGEWLFSHVLGIQPDWNQPGFQSFLLKPFPSRRLGSATGSYRSIHGTIRSEWRFDDRGFHWSIEIPANTNAAVLVPLGLDLAFSATGSSPTPAHRILHGNAPRASLLLGSGTYGFSSSFRG